jgi:hypothetical protein
MKHKKKLTQPRIYFDGDEYRALIKASQANIRFHKRKKTRWVADAEELHDYIIFMVNTGLRVGESRQLLMSGVKIISQPNGEEICKLTIKDGKRGPGVAVSRCALQRHSLERSLVKPSPMREPGSFRKLQGLTPIRPDFSRCMRVRAERDGHALLPHHEAQLGTGINLAAILPQSSGIQFHGHVLRAHRFQERLEQRGQIPIRHDTKFFGQIRVGDHVEQSTLHGLG